MVGPASPPDTRPRLRIAFFVTNFPKLSEIFLLNQALALIDRGHTVDIFALTTPREARVQPGTERLIDHVHVAGMPKGPLSRFADLPGLVARNRLDHVLAALDPVRQGAEAITLRNLYRLDALRDLTIDHDVVHAQLGSVARQAVLMRRLGRFDAPLVTSFRGSDLSRYLAHGMPGAYRAVFETAAFCLPVAARWVEPLVGIGCPREKIRHMPSGIPVARIGLRDPSRATNSDAPRLISACRLERYKGIHLALEAFALLRQNHPGARYEIFGDGPERVRLMAETQRLGIADAVRFHGAAQHEEILAALLEADLHWFTTITRFDGRTEGVPNILKESQSAGLPAVAFDHPGTDEVVLDGETGLIVPEGDAAALAAASSRLVADADLMRRMGALASTRARKTYDLDTLTDRLEDIYHAAIAGARHAQPSAAAVTAS